MSDVTEIKWHNAFDAFSNVPNVVFSEVGGNYEYIKIDTTPSLMKAVRDYSPLSSLLIKMATMYSNGLMEFVNSKSKKFVQGENKAWEKLFKKPNPIQTGLQFRTQLAAFTLMRGFCYVMPYYAAGFPDVPYALWILPPQFIEVEPIQRAPHKTMTGEKLRRVFFCYGGIREELNEADLLLFEDTGSPFINDLTFLPESRLMNLKYPISNGIGAWQSRHSLIHDRGAMGILANTASDQMGEIPMQEDEKLRLQEYYKGQYGLTRDKKSSIIVTSAAMSWQSMSFNVKDLMLHEEDEACMKACCDQYGFPYRLFATSEGATYNNQNEDKKSAYQDCIIPFADSCTEQWVVGLRMLDYNVEMLYTFEHLPVFQMSQKEKGEGLVSQMSGLEKMWNLNLITRNGMLLKLGEDVINGELKEMYDKFKFQLTPEEQGIIQTEIANDPKDPKEKKPDDKK